MQKIHYSIAIPSNVLEDCSDLRSKTQKIGHIARAAAIFKVEKIIIYSIDKIIKGNFSLDIKLIKGILEYLDCPQYLRRLMFPKQPIFKYVGILPPLQTPHHPLENEIAKLEPISIREGLILSSNSQSSEIEIGLERPINIRVPNLSPKTRIILKLEKSGNAISGSPIKKAQTEKYWGYNVDIFKESLKKFRDRFSNYLILATSRKGSPLQKTDLDFFQTLKEKPRILLIFGSPSMGLFEIFENDGLKLEDCVDHIINIAPEQGTQTIRVEEAVMATLAILNCLMTL